jgi:hypothetical protein
MTAIGWYVQMVHYPTFRLIAKSDWAIFHKNHSTFTGMIVLLPMLIEGTVSVMLIRAIPQEKALTISSAAAGLFAIGWTFAVSSVIHGQLSSAPNPDLINKLIATNLPRTIAWSVHMILSIVILWRLFGVSSVYIWKFLPGG